MRADLQNNRAKKTKLTVPSTGPEFKFKGSSHTEHDANGKLLLAFSGHPPWGQSLLISAAKTCSALRRHSFRVSTSFGLADFHKTPSSFLSTKKWIMSVNHMLQQHAVQEKALIKQKLAFLDFQKLEALVKVCSFA